MVCRCDVSSRPEGQALQLLRIHCSPESYHSYLLYTDADSQSVTGELDPFSEEQVRCLCHSRRQLKSKKNSEHWGKLLISIAGNHPLFEYQTPSRPIRAT